METERETWIVAGRINEKWEPNELYLNLLNGCNGIQNDGILSFVPPPGNANNSLNRNVLKLWKWVKHL